MSRSTVCVMLAFVLGCVPATVLGAVLCPFCDAPTLVMAEQIQMCDHLLLGRYVSGVKSTEVTAGSSRFEIVEIGFSKGEKFQKGQILEIPQYVAAAEGATFTLMGPEERLEDWNAPMEATPAAWQYLSKMPLPTTDVEQQGKRLEYFIPFFESSDMTISNDAFAEFAAAPYAVIKPLRDKLPREKILGWLNDPKVSVTRVGFYGLMAGLCGREEDAAILEHKIMTLDADFRLGIEGVMAGYMLLRGEEGLRVLEDGKMRTKVAKDAAGKEVPLPFSETYAVMQALRFMWTYEPERISQERLKASMRILLERQELADLVITDLARWKDWSVQDRLMSMYGDEKFAIPAIRRAIVRYLYYCSQEQGEKGADGTAVRPAWAVRADELLKELEQKDPKTVSDAKRFLVR